MSGVRPPSNAYQAGLRDGDRIVKIGNMSVDDSTRQNIMRMFKTVHHIVLEIEILTDVPSTDSSKVSDVTEVCKLHNVTL